MRRAAIGYTKFALPGRLMAGRQTLDLVVVVRIHPRQPKSHQGASDETLRGHGQGR